MAAALCFLATGSLVSLFVGGPMGGRLGPAVDKRVAPPAEPAAPVEAPSVEPVTPAAGRGKAVVQPPTADAKPSAARRRPAPKASVPSKPEPKPEPLAEPEPEGPGVAPLESEPLLPAPLQVEYAAQGPTIPAQVRPLDYPPVQRGPSVVARPTVVPPAAEAVDAPVVATTESEQPNKWYDAISLGAMADAYASVNAVGPRKFGLPNEFRAFDSHNGFALHWAGIDAGYDGETFGGTVGLRFGPSAARYNGADADIGLGFVKQAFATYKPRFADGKLRLDFGKFDTIYGGEVADSQMNFNYTRAFLNWLGQPFFHAGLRIGYQVTEKISLTGIVVNGWNNSLDNNRGKSFGAQLGWTPGDRFSLYLGYLTGPENAKTAEVACEAETALDRQTGNCTAAPGSEASVTELSVRNADRRFRQFGDLIVNVSPTDRLALSFNADLGYDEVIDNPISGAFTRALWYGGALSGRYRFTDMFATAARAEAYHDVTGFTAPATWLGSGTVTFELVPHENLILKLDSRYDGAADPVFPGGPNGMSDRQITFTLGVVVATH